jgi:endonuclease/exonuclease/phosphatase family metal-dependent hydrolase
VSPARSVDEGPLVATLNLRNIADRWPERIPLLLADMAALQPDVIGLQECVYAVGQDRLMAGAGDGHYAIRRGWAGRPEYGNAILVKEPLRASAAERLDLGLSRSAVAADVGGPGAETPRLAATLRFVVTHLHHLTTDPGLRDEQAARIVDWLAPDPQRPLVLVGDFNASPSEPAYQRIVDAGFRSAYREANGTEPDVTWPSGIQAEGMDTDGEPRCLDYIWLRGPLAAAWCRLAFDRPAADDPTLYPSDHLGLVARLRVTSGG